MGGQDVLPGKFNEISRQCIQNALEGFVEDELLASAVMRGIDLRVDFAKERNFLTQDSEIKKSGFERVVNISGVVSNLIDPVDKLRFEGRTQIQEILRKLRKFRRGIIARMLDDT